MSEDEHEAMETTSPRTAEMVRVAVAEALLPFMEDYDHHVQEWPAEWQEAYHLAPSLEEGQRRIQVLRSLDAADAALQAIEKSIKRRMVKGDV